ncbi:hypothetical protein [Actinomadura fibrosa]|uniref:hypothetical protein n=1 Tax=Actinomadura fibrosa TaxID=111802 RepID=UPI001040F8C1|nr:hypothetical protein [Actinomadura fibrosa]
MAAGKDGWLAVGYDQAAPRRPLVVTSADGATWQAADSAAAFRPTRSGIPATNAAAAGPAGYVVVGTEGASAAAWTSPDLKEWERGTSAGQRELEGRPGAARWMLDVVGGSFGYVAVGGSRDAKGNHPSVWSSSDGRKWTLQQLPLPTGTGVTEAHLTHVAVRGNTLAAAGIAATPQGLVWLAYVSADGGKTWRQASGLSGAGGAGGTAKLTVTALTATPKGFAATCASGTAGAADVVSLTSADGASWTAATPGGTGLGGDGDQRVTGLAAFKGTLLGVGRSTDANDDQPVLWTRPVP